MLDTAGKQAVPGQYVVGWAKRGPSGLIGTNRADSVATVAAMLEDFKAGRLPGRDVDADPACLPRLLAAQGARAVNFSDWKRLDALEVENGRKAGKIREKFCRVEDMLSALTTAPT